LERKNQYIRTNCLNIVLIGPESTGKTTLAKALAEQYRTFFVPEYARIYAEKHTDKLTYQDVIPIAEGQHQLEVNYTLKANRILFYDTNLLQTKVYSEWYYNKCPNELNDLIKISKYDFYFLNYIDVPWEEDDLRDKPREREYMFNAFETALITYNKPYVLLKGNKHERLKTAIHHIDQLLKLNDEF